MIQIIYGKYTQDDLKEMYENGLKDSSLYLTSLKSEIVKTLKITMSTVNGTSVFMISPGMHLEIIYNNQLDGLYHAIGKVTGIHSPETICLDCSTAYQNSLHSIEVGNIRYIRILTEEEDIAKGGLHIRLSDYDKIINEDKCECEDCDCITEEELQEQLANSIDSFKKTVDEAIESDTISDESKNWINAIDIILHQIQQSQIVNNDEKESDE